MHRERATGQGHLTDRSAQSGARAHRERPQSEALHVRSYDYHWSYDLDVELVTNEGETVFREGYYLLPGHTESEVSIPNGEYDLHVTLDNKHEESMECRIGSTPEHTAVIEIGNSAIALTEGFYS